MGCSSSVPQGSSDTSSATKAGARNGSAKGSEKDSKPKLPNGSTTSSTTTHHQHQQQQVQQQQQQPQFVLRDYKPEELAIIVKIQRATRSHQARMRALAEQQWKIFSDLDALEEAEMLHLATFLQILMKEVPSTDQKEAEALEELKNGGGEGGGAISISHIKVEIGSTHQLTHGGDFEMDKAAPISPATAAHIIEVYRNKGKVSSATCTKILRKGYASLKARGNFTRIRVPDNGKITVVGDIHGSIIDLLYILDVSGPPSSVNLFVFNGDFVDRGKNGVEVMVLLLTLLVAYPEYVFLNRGNHEDGPITQVYGFQDECVSKYDELTFGMFVEIFKHLPVFTIIDDVIFVVHGGLFNNRAVTLDELEKIDRYSFVGEPAIPYPDCLQGLEPDEQWREYQFQLMRDALWSDPRKELGMLPSPRGTGVHFGPDVAQEFMTNNGFSMIIRSHECVRRGFFLPFEGHANPALARLDNPLLCTVFSASNYGTGDNEGAFIVLMNHSHSRSNSIPRCKLHYSVHQYRNAREGVNIEKSNKSSLAELILKKKSALLGAFETIDTTNSGSVSRLEWAEVMQRVTTVKIRWLGLIDSIAPKECLSPSSVNYRLFLANFTVQAPHSSPSAAVGDQSRNLDALYTQRKKLQLIFNYFDTNGDGVISREEFHIGCNKLNEHLPEGQRLTEIDHSLDLMDFDGNGVIDINEFFETFRMVDSSGKL